MNFYSRDYTKGVAKTSIGQNDLGYDAWGRAKVVNDYSMYHGMWTFDVSDSMWLEFFNGVEQPKTNYTSIASMLVGVSNGGVAKLSSKRNPRYQPNRGLLYSNSFMFDNATRTNGKLYAVVRSGGVDDAHELNFPDGYSPLKGNIYDIQLQWRGVGGIKFFINQEQAVTFNYLGTLDTLSIENPALPIAFECSNDGTIRMGSFTDNNGYFFEWRFDTPQETQLRCGCVDVTSEGGSKESRQYLSAATSTDSGSIAASGFNDPIIAIRLPDTFKGKINTRDAILTRISGYSDNKSILRVWYTRNGVGVTGGTWATIPGSNVEVSENITSITPASMGLVFSARIALDDSISILNPDPVYGDFYLVHGDYIIVTIHRENGGSSLSGATIEMEVEI